MALDFRLDSDKLRAFPLRLKMVLGVLLIEVAVLAAALVVSDSLDAEVTRIQELRTQLSQIRRQSVDLRRQIDQYPTLRAQYDHALGGGILGPLDSMKFVNDAEDGARRHYLTNLRYKVETPPLQDSGTDKYRETVTLLSLDSGALLDSEVMAFWTETLRSLPSHYHVLEASLERAGPVDAALLNQIQAGSPAAIMRLHMTVQWLSLRSKVGAAP
jgi:hypothetical protein